MRNTLQQATQIAKKKLKVLLRDRSVDPIKKAAGNGYMYLATVYTQHPGGIHTAFEDASRAAAWFVERGVCVFCPIAHTHPIAIHGKIDPLSHDIWIPMDKPLMSQAEGLIVVKMPGWEKSLGISIEIKEFEKANKPIFYIEWPLPE